jgi:NAD-dependent deacetylase
MTNLIVLTGAGISAESGIQTFRAADGLWENYDVRDVASPEGFKRNPALVHKFYNDRRSLLKTVEPNEGHDALAKLEEGWKDGDFVLISQNIDDLHEKSGSKKLLKIHGDLRISRCVSCSYEGEYEETSPETQCPKCALPMRPDVVWFGEMPYHLDSIEPLLDRANIFIAVGTSGTVMPASLFAASVRWGSDFEDTEVIEVNPVPTGDTAFTRVIAGTATEALPPLVDELLLKYQRDK